ncbi:hypothetical protein [Metabacillus fastidiosus]|uniref:hypothetical protein n=1 Tax=Metabacillus fastidiosus TaxID=1458 RepID=UPI003D297AD5
MELFNKKPVSQAQKEREEAEKNLLNLVALPTEVEALKKQNAMLLIQDAAKTKELLAVKEQNAAITLILAKNGLS